MYIAMHTCLVKKRPKTKSEKSETNARQLTFNKFFRTNNSAGIIINGTKITSWVRCPGLLSFKPFKFKLHIRDRRSERPRFDRCKLQSCWRRKHMRTEFLLLSNETNRMSPQGIDKCLGGNVSCLRS